MIRLDSGVSTVIDFTEAQTQSRLSRQLRAEAVRLVRQIGPNAYSDYLFKHGHRPLRQQAETIGRLIGLRVKASNGKRYPRLSKDEVHRRSEEAVIAQKIDQLRIAICYLAQCSANLSKITRHVGASDEVAISQNLEKAIGSLLRFAEEWNCRHGQEITSKVSNESP